MAAGSLGKVGATIVEGIAAIILLFALGIPGWYLCERLGVPLASLVGPMLSVALASSLGFPFPEIPYFIRPLIQILVGLYVGTQIRRDAVQAIGGMMAPALLASGWWLASSLGLGLALYRLTHLDLKTALIGSTAGGVAEMSILAVALGANAGVVVLLQFFRLAMTMMAVPLLGPRLFSRGSWSQEAAAARDQGDLGTGPPFPVSPPPEASIPEKIRTLVLAFLGGGLLYAVGFPAGGLVGAMLAVGAGRVLGCRCPEPGEGIKVGSRMGLGGLLGLNFTPETLSFLAEAALPVVILTLTILLNGFLLALVIRRLTGWSIETCVLGTAAGGLPQMCAISEEMGADPVPVALLHLVRLISIVALLPPLFLLIL